MNLWVYGELEFEIVYNTAAVIVSLDEYTIKTIFGDGTVELSILDRESRMHKPDSMNIDDNNEHRWF